MDVKDRMGISQKMPTLGHGGMHGASAGSTKMQLNLFQESCLVNRKLHLPQTYTYKKGQIHS